MCVRADGGPLLKEEKMLEDRLGLGLGLNLTLVHLFPLLPNLMLVRMLT